MPSISSLPLLKEIFSLITSRHTIILMFVLAQELRITTKEISSATEGFMYFSLTLVLPFKLPFSDLIVQAKVELV